MSLPNNASVLWQPTEKQAEFLAADEEEVLFGGSAGGGKSDCLLIDALGLQQSALLYPRYRAILFRKTFPELRELIDRSQLIYPSVYPGAKYSSDTKEWRFPSGAKVEFGYLDTDNDRFRYQGREYQYIGWDELTHLPPHPDPESENPASLGYMFLLSRLRAPKDLPLKCYVRATSNPGGPGHAWVQARWRIPNDGSATRVPDEQTGQVRRFIPAKLADNPHLSETGYRERLMLLPEAERKALLDGIWELPDALHVFPRGDLSKAKAECYKPIARAELHKSDFREREDGHLRIWEKPRTDRRYVVGADVAEGIHRGDYSCADVLDTIDGSQVAQWHGRVAPDRFADVLYALGKMYNKALLGVERNNHGLVTCTLLRDGGYPNLYAQGDLEYRGSQDRETKKVGWLTTAKSKFKVIDQLAGEFRDGDARIYCAETIAECETFVVDDDGSYGAQPGCHDDRVMSRAIAGEMLRSGYARTSRRAA